MILLLKRTLTYHQYGNCIEHHCPVSWGQLSRSWNCHWPEGNPWGPEGKNEAKLNCEPWIDSPWRGTRLKDNPIFITILDNANWSNYKVTTCLLARGQIVGSGRIKMFAFRLLANRRQDVFGMKLIKSLFNRHQLNQQKQILPNQVVSRYLMDLRSLRTESILFSSSWHFLRIKKITHGFIPSIVAIHGLNGHREDTWTVNGVNWLRDLLPSNIPNARIYSWGYDANTHSTSQISSEYLYDHAKTLISDLCLERRMTIVRVICLHRK